MRRNVLADLKLRVWGSFGLRTKYPTDSVNELH